MESRKKPKGQVSSSLQQLSIVVCGCEIPKRLTLVCNQQVSRKQGA